MAVYKRGETYWYEFNHRGARLRGSTGCTSKREAQEFERAKRQEAAKAHERREALGREPLTWAVAAARYWEELGQHHRRADGTLWSLEWLTRHLGEGMRLRDIDGGVVARLVALRRGEGVSNATVNRTLTAPLRGVLNRARLWGEVLPAIEFRKHMLPQPRERVRELRADEEAVLFAALRPDYHPLVRFALLTGCRLSECVGLTWADVDWGGRVIWVNGKGGKRASIPLPSVVRELLWPLQGQHPTAVFTYAAERGGHNVRKGSRQPVTYEGLKTHWQRARASAGLRDYRFHDNRHTAATRVLRASGNLNVVKRLLRHEDIATTVKYAHSQHEDVLAAMENAAAQHEVPTRAPTQGGRNRAKA